MKEKLEAVYNRLQTLDIKPTKTNMESLLRCLYDLQEVYKGLTKEAEPDGTDGPENRPEG